MHTHLLIQRDKGRVKEPNKETETDRGRKTETQRTLETF